MSPRMDFTTPSGQWFDKSIEGIRLLYGRNTANGVALDFEYPLPTKSQAQLVSRK